MFVGAKPLDHRIGLPLFWILDSTPNRIYYGRILANSIYIDPLQKFSPGIDVQGCCDELVDGTLFDLVR